MPSILIIHIAACSTGYLLFGAAFIIACTYIYRDRKLKTKQFKLDDTFPWSLRELDRYLFFTLLAGFFFLGLGIPLGVAYQQAMHHAVDFTSIRLLFPTAIWLFYLVVLIFRVAIGLRGKVPAYLSAYGFSCAAFSFIYELHISTP